MANILSAIQPVLFSAARVVPRELTGYVGAVSRDFNDMQVAKGDSVKVNISPVQSVADVTASATFSAGTDRTPTSTTLTLNQFKETSWNLTAEQERSLLNGGVLAADFMKQTVEQGIRALVNSMETYVGAIAQVNASRAYGTAGTAPFASTMADLAAALKIIRDNGAPTTGLKAVVNTAAELNARSLTNLFKVNEAGDQNLLRNGVIGQLYGADVLTTAGVKQVTKGTGTLYTTNTAGYAIGATAITLITGTGTVNAGEVVTFAGDTNKYVVAAGIAAPGTITLQEPGLMQAIPTSATALTVGNSYASNSVFHENAIKLVCRPAIQPEGAAFEQQVISDAVTGLSFLLIRVPQNAQASWFLRVVYDAFAPNPYALATLLG